MSTQRKNGKTFIYSLCGNVHLSPTQGQIKLLIDLTI